MSENRENVELTLKPVSPYRWEVPLGTVSGMRTTGQIIASPDMVDRIIEDRTPLQVANVATLPGIVGVSLAMPDIHWGYGFPIGGVAAFDLEEGVISPGGVGYDINCGVCLVSTQLNASEVRPRIKELVDTLFEKVPCGVGSEGKIKLTRREFDRVMTIGARWVVEYGLADPEDLEHLEERGCIAGADPSLVSDRARERAEQQLGTLGSGNHFLEVQEVVEIYHPEAAQAFGLFPGQIVIMIHSGSRGLGHQICDETLKVMQQVARREGIQLVDRQLACAPIRSPEGQRYLAAMRCAANFAWANRLAMVGLTRQAFQQVFRRDWKDLGMKVVYDVAHNIAKIEEYERDGKKVKVCVHRKGATRSFGKGHPDLPADYRSVGQPVLIPGDMGRASFVLVGLPEASATTWGSTCHGAGRLLSRHAAIRSTKGQDIIKRMEKLGVTVRARGRETLYEEVPEAYKNVTEVVEAVEGAGISAKVAKLKPVGTVKG